MEGDMCVECEENIPAGLEINTINASILWTKTLLECRSLTFLHIKTEILEVELSFSFISSFIVTIMYSVDSWAILNIFCSNK